MRAITSSKAGDVQGAMAGDGAPEDVHAAAGKPDAADAGGKDFAGYLDAKQPGNGGQSLSADNAPVKPDGQAAKDAAAPQQASTDLTQSNAGLPKANPASPQTAAGLSQAATVLPQAVVATISAAPRKVSAPEKKTNSKDDAATDAAAQQAMAVNAMTMQMPVQPVVQTTVKGDGDASVMATGGKGLGQVQGGSVPMGMGGQAGTGAQIDAGVPANAQTVTQANAAANAAAVQAGGLGGQVKAVTPASSGASISATTKGKSVPAWAAGRAVKGGAAEIADGGGKSEVKGSGGVEATDDGKNGDADPEELASNGTSGALHGQPMAVSTPMQQSKNAFQVGGSVRLATETGGSSAAAGAANAPVVATTTAKALPSQISTRPVTGATVQPATAVSSFAIANTAAAGAEKSFGTGAASEAARQQALTASTLNRVMDVAATMRSNGQDRVSLQVKLDDGQQVTVRLQMTQGILHPVFKTESTELRQALEQNWAGFRSNASEKGLEIATPVFESPASESGFGSFGSREQSGQSGAENFEAEEGLAGQGSQGAAKTLTNPTVTTAPAMPESGVQLYA